MDDARTESVSAIEVGLQRCPSCGRVQRIDDERACQRCGETITPRRHMSLQRTWSFLIVGIIAFIPAQVMPVLKTTSFMGNHEDTILSGVSTLISTGSYVVAIIIFFASICIPMIKFIIIALLATCQYFAWEMSDHTQHRMHTLTELIGRWSMIDVFVVAVLAALIQLGAIITITPGAGINAFALSVVFTMLAASSLDSRLLWDTQITTEISPEADSEASPDTNPETYSDQMKHSHSG